MKNKYFSWILITLIVLIIILLIVLLLPDNNKNNPTPSTTTTHTHSFGEWVIEEEAACESKGLMSRVCECGNKDTMTLAELGHSFADWYTSLNPTCETTGIKERICTNCDYKETKPIETIMHEGDYFTIIDNQKHYLCIHCEKSYKIEELDISNGLTISNGKVTSIGNCLDSEIIVPYKATAIGKGAFEYKKITSIILLDTITVIEENAFYKCFNLKAVYFGNSISKIDNKAFFNCKSIISITLPDNLETLGAEAFAYCSELEKVYLSNSIDKLEYGAFKNCKNLSDIHFNGTIQEWNNIYKADDWDFNTGNYTVHCTNGDIKNK